MSVEFVCACYKICKQMSKEGVARNKSDHDNHVNELKRQRYALCECNTCTRILPGGVYVSYNTMRSHESKSKSQFQQSHHTNNEINDQMNQHDVIESKYDDENDDFNLEVESATFDNDVDDYIDVEEEIDHEEEMLDQEIKERNHRQQLVDNEQNNDDNISSDDNNDRGQHNIVEQMPSYALNLFRMMSKNKLTQNAINDQLEYEKITFAEQFEKKGMAASYKELDEICEDSKAHYILIKAHYIQQILNFLFRVLLIHYIFGNRFMCVYAKALYIMVIRLKKHFVRFLLVVNLAIYKIPKHTNINIQNETIRRIHLEKYFAISLSN